MMSEYSTLEIINYSLNGKQQEINYACIIMEKHGTFKGFNIFDYSPNVYLLSLRLSSWTCGSVICLDLVT